MLVLRARGAVGGGARLQAVHQQQGGAMCETEEDERRQQHRRATTGVCERGEALCEDAEQQVRTMILVARESGKHAAQVHLTALLPQPPEVEKVRQDASTSKRSLRWIGSGGVLVKPF